MIDQCSFICTIMIFFASIQSPIHRSINQLIKNQSPCGMMVICTMCVHCAMFLLICPVRPPACYTDVGERYKDTYIPLIDEDIDDEDDEGKVLSTRVKCH